MPRRAIVRVMLAVLLGAAIWLPAQAAYADPCCSVALNGVPSAFQAGADASQFSSTMNIVAPVKQVQPKSVAAYLRLTGNNLNTNQIRVALRKDGGNWRSAKFSRQNGFLQLGFRPYEGQQRSGQVGYQFRLAFDSGAPAQSFSVSLLLVADYGKGHRMQSQGGPAASTVTAVAAPPATPTPIPVPTPSAAQSIPVPTPSAVVTAPSGNASAVIIPTVASTGTPASSGSSFMWLVYTIGILLVLAGAAIVGILFYRRGKNPPDDEWGNPTATPTGPVPGYGGYPQQGYQPQGMAPDPTRALPIQQTQVYGGAADATQVYGGPADRTQAYQQELDSGYDPFANAPDDGVPRNGGWAAPTPYGRGAPSTYGTVPPQNPPDPTRPIPPR
jgi:hypothetical protein